MSACIMWSGPVNNKGYGVRSFQGKSRLAHRVAFFEAHGYWPNVCRHTCDNRPCVNAEHLVDGTHADNSKDMVDRGRWRWSGVEGEKHGQAKLTVEKVRAIRQLYATRRHTQKQLAELFGMKQPTISEIVRGVIWKSVEMN